MTRVATRVATSVHAEEVGFAPVYRINVWGDEYISIAMGLSDSTDLMTVFVHPREDESIAELIRRTLKQMNSPEVKHLTRDGATSKRKSA